MSEMRSLLVETAQRVFADHADLPDPPAALWRAMADAGISMALHPDMAGAISLADAAALLRPAAYYAAAVPLPETLLAQWLLAGTSGPVPSTAMALAASPLAAQRMAAGWHVKADIARVAWLRGASHIVLPLVGDGQFLIALVPVDQREVRPGSNLAGEPRDGMTIDMMLADVRPVTGRAPGDIQGDIQTVGAAFRSIQLAGALARVLDLTVTYVQDRVQFGKPLAKLQAVQQLCAVLAGHVAAASAAADLAIDGLAAGIDRRRVAAAKLRCGEAAGIAAAIAHQLHGAMGVTREHRLHLLTRRLWSWRDEFGSEAYWSAWLGRDVAANGPESLWPLITEAA